MIYLLLFLFVTALMILLPLRRGSLVTTGVLITLVMLSSSWHAISTLAGSADIIRFPVGNSGSFPLILICDKLSAFFILVINFTVLSGFLYSIGYLEPYLRTKPPKWIKLHYLEIGRAHV